MEYLKECPCRKCKKQGCGAYHDKCTEYQEWRKVADKFNLKRRQELESDTYFFGRPKQRR